VNTKEVAVPYALNAGTAHRWATERAVELFVMFAGDLSACDVVALAADFASVREDGARLAVIDAPGGRAGDAEKAAVDFVVHGVAAPLPYGIFGAMQAAGVDDARKVGVIGTGAEAIEAGHRAGAGAVIGIAAAGSRARRELLDAQPDVIVEAGEFAALDRVRFARSRAHRQRVLLNPGPAVVSDRVHRAIGGPDLCHREAEYSDILEGVKRKLFRVAGVGDDWAMVMIAGSGTAAMEAMTGACVRPGRRLVVCRNGIYGDRILTIARRLGIETVVVAASDLEPIDPGAVAAALDADSTIDAVAVIHHETTTGLLNPVHEIAAEAARRGVLVVCDAISSLGAEELDLDGTGIDFVASTSNKCLHGLPGCAFVLVSPRGQERIEAVPPRSLYFDLPNYLKAQAKRTVPFTPAIPALYGLDAALDELLDEGVEERKAYYRTRMEYLDRAFAGMGLEPRVAPESRSRSVRSLPLPAGIGYDALHGTMKAEGYVIYGGLGEAAKTSFRVCALGALKIEALEGFVAVLERTIAGMAVAAD
jgi:2-aminoethylphosphonate-pyruvate transaminase